MQSLSELDSTLRKMRNQENPKFFFGSLVLDDDNDKGLVAVRPLPALEPYYIVQWMPFKFIAGRAKRIEQRHDRLFNTFKWYGIFSDKCALELRNGKRDERNNINFVNFSTSLSAIIDDIPNMLDTEICTCGNLKKIPKKKYHSVVEDLKAYIALHLNLAGLMDED